MVKNYQGGTRKTCVLHWHINMSIWGDKTSTHLLRELQGNFFPKETVQLERRRAEKLQREA